MKLFSLVLGAYLHNLPADELQNKRIIEIGSGCGVPGIVAARKGAKVVVTELSDELDFLQQNILANIPDEDPVSSNIEVKELFWGTDTSSLDPPFEIILGADVVYEIQLFPELIQSLRDLCGPNTVILLALEHRWKDIESWFFADLEKYFINHGPLPHDCLDTVYRHPKIDIYRLTKRVMNTNEWYFHCVLL